MIQLVKNAQTLEMEYIIPGTIVSRPDALDLTLNNDKKTPYGLVDVKLENGDVTTSRLYKASDDANSGKFGVGSPVSVRMQADGEYAGRSVIQLPSAQPYDVSKIADMFKAQGGTVPAEAVAASL